MPVKPLKAEDLHPLVARTRTATLTSLSMLHWLHSVPSRAGESLVAHHWLLWIIWMIRYPELPFSASSNTCWVMVNQNSTTAPRPPKSTLIAQSVRNWVWGLKSPVCSESMHVLERLLLVHRDHTYANSLSWSRSIERIAANIRHTERLYTGPYNHWIELRASVKGGVFLSRHIPIHGPERDPVYCCTDAFESFSKTFSV